MDHKGGELPMCGCRYAMNECHGSIFSEKKVKI